MNSFCQCHFQLPDSNVCVVDTHSASVTITAQFFFLLWFASIKMEFFGGEKIQNSAQQSTQIIYAYSSRAVFFLLQINYIPWKIDCIFPFSRKILHDFSFSCNRNGRAKSILLTIRNRLLSLENKAIEARCTCWLIDLWIFILKWDKEKSGVQLNRASANLYFMYVQFYYLA